MIHKRGGGHAGDYHRWTQSGEEYGSGPLGRLHRAITSSEPLLDGRDMPHVASRKRN